MNPGEPISGVVSPVDPMTVFINSYDGAVLKTTDGGQTWVDASRGYTGADMRDITISPDSPHIVYAVSKSGIARSYSGGEDWEEIAYPPIREPNWYAIAMNPLARDELLVAHDRRGSIHKSSDGGNSWNLVFEHPEVDDRFVREKAHGFKSIVYSSSETNIIYAGMARVYLLGTGEVRSEAKSFGIYKSTDGGDNWQEKNTGLEGTSKNIHCIAVHPTNPDIVYIGTAHDGAFKTNDGGETWTAINNGLVECPSYLQRVGAVNPGISLNIPKRTTGGNYYSLPWSNIESIVIDPSDSQTVYAADFYLGVYMSTDGGENWLPINDGLTTRAIYSMAISSDGRVLYAATSGEGVFRLLLW
ncbi:MAG: hypothetical protein AVO34_13965 [Firmicutes bacterium ML8_F2]|nr:MAG: hypothetical protein AVO34_13965 [Firmicutes bacterium ML8_F2]